MAKINILLLSLLSFLLFRCAQFVPPTGGPRDIEAPKLISSTPNQKTLNFKGQEISLTFSELIDANSLRQELIITPDPKSTYEVKVKTNSLRLKFDKPFADSTTYTFNFQKGIKDLNEANPAENLKFIFSTGSEIDSLSIKGQILNIFTNLPPKECLVAIYNINKKDTLTLLKRKPDYFVKSDSAGKYTFDNIKPNHYRLLAFTDLNSNLLFDEKNEIFSFYKDTIKLDSNIIDINLKIYPANLSPPKVRRALSRTNNFSITFDKPLETAKLTFDSKSDSLTYKLIGNELLIFNHPIKTDTILTNVLVVDSVNNTLEFKQKVYFGQQASRATKKEAIDLRPNHSANNKLKKPITYEFDFSEPISSIDTSKIQIIGDTTYNELYIIKWKDDSQTQLQISTTPKAKRTIALKIGSGAITNYKSDTNATYQLINTLYQQEEYGSLAGRYLEDTTNKIVQIIDAESYKLIDYQLFTKSFEFKNVIPGNYLLRLIIDRNKNGKWDSGSFNENTQAEEVIIFKEVIRLKANFEISDILIN